MIHENMEIVGIEIAARNNGSTPNIGDGSTDGRTAGVTMRLWTKASEAGVGYRAFEQKEVR